MAKFSSYYRNTCFKLYFCVQRYEVTINTSGKTFLCMIYSCLKQGLNYGFNLNSFGSLFLFYSSHQICTKGGLWRLVMGSIGANFLIS